MNGLLKALLMLSVAIVLGFCCQCSWAQNFGRPVNLTVQRPVVRNFSVRTVVSVPDGGTISLSGGSNFSSGQTSRGIPGFRGPLFRSRSSGYSAAASGASLKASIISTREIDEDLSAEGRRRGSLRVTTDLNGSRAVQSKADFITRNIGRKR